MIQRMAEVFRKDKLPYVIIGGIASSILGKPRMTMDADVVILLSSENICGFIQDMKRNGFNVTVASEPKIIARLKRGLPVKLRYKKKFSVDMRLASYSIDRKAIKRANKRTIFNVKLPIATPEDLIIYKLVRFDEIDQADIKAVLVRYIKKLDFKYIIKTVKELSNETRNIQIENNLKYFLSWTNKH